MLDGAVFQLFSSLSLVKKRHLAYNRTEKKRTSISLTKITLYNGFFMLYRFSSLFLFYCTLCMLHVAHFVFWITLYNVLFVLFRFSSLFLFYCTVCIFGLHYFIVYLCYALSSFSFCFIN